MSLGVIPAEPGRRAVGRAAGESVDVRLNRAVVEHDVALVVGPGVPARGRGLLRRQQVLLPGGRGPGDHRPLALARRADHQRRHHRHPRHHAGPGAHRRGGRADPGRAPSRSASSPSRAAGALHAATFGEPRAAWAAAAEVSAETHVRYLDAPVRRVLSVMPGEVRRHLDRRQGLLQARAGRRRRRRGHPLRAAHHPDLGDAPGDRARSATTAATTSCGSGTGSGTCTGACSRTPPTCAAPAPTTPSTGSGCRLTVTLATGIPEDVVRAREPRTTSTRPPSTSRHYRADGETLVVPEAGEVLFRLR